MFLTNLTSAKADHCPDRCMPLSYLLTKITRLFHNHQEALSGGLDLYEDVLTTREEIDPEEEVLQAQVGLCSLYIDC